jgi:hypothetical protein
MTTDDIIDPTEKARLALFLFGVFFAKGALLAGFALAN